MERIISKDFSWPSVRLAGDNSLGMRLSSVLELQLLERCLDKHWTSSRSSGEGFSRVCGQVVTSPTSNPAPSGASLLAKAPEAGARFEGNGSLMFEKAVMFMSQLT